MVEVSLYDLQGRRVLRDRLTTSGAGVDLLGLTLNSRVRSGVYLLRARGDDGRLSRVLKIVVLR